MTSSLSDEILNDGVSISSSFDAANVPQASVPSLNVAVGQAAALLLGGDPADLSPDEMATPALEMDSEMVVGNLMGPAANVLSSEETAAPPGITTSRLDVGDSLDDEDEDSFVPRGKFDAPTSSGRRKLEVPSRSPTAKCNSVVQAKVTPRGPPKADKPSLPSPSKVSLPTPSKGMKSGTSSRAA